MAEARDQLVARWRDLVQGVLPGMTAGAGWPIRLDHCFMRVCLDHAVGNQWDRVVKRPAVRCMTDAQLGRAVAVAEAIVAEPASLHELNRQSLAWRGKLRA